MWYFLSFKDNFVKFYIFYFTQISGDKFLRIFPKNTYTTLSLNIETLLSPHLRDNVPIVFPLVKL